MARNGWIVRSANAVFVLFCFCCFFPFGSSSSPDPWPGPPHPPVYPLRSLSCSVAPLCHFGSSLTPGPAGLAPNPKDPRAEAIWAQALAQAIIT